MVHHLKAFSGTDFSMFRSLFAYNTNFTGGVRVAVADVNADGFADIITGHRSGTGTGTKHEVARRRTDTLLLDIAFTAHSKAGCTSGKKLVTWFRRRLASG